MEDRSSEYLSFKVFLKSRWNQSHPHIGNGGREAPGTGISEGDSPSYFTWATWKHGFYSLGFVTFVVSVWVCLCAQGQTRVCLWNTLSYQGVPVHFLMSIRATFHNCPLLDSMPLYPFLDIKVMLHNYVFIATRFFMFL